MTTMTTMWSLLAGAGAWLAGGTRALADRIGPALAEVAAPALAGWGVRGVLVLAAAGAATLLFRRRSAALRHLVWSLGVGVLLVLPVLEAAVPAWRVGPAIGPAAAAPAPAEAAAATAAVRVSGTGAAASAAAPAATPPEAAPPAPAAVAPRPPVAGRVSAGGSAEVAVSAAPSPAPASSTAPAAPAGLPDLPADPALLLLVAWFLGASGLLAHLAIGILRADGLAREAEPVRDPRILSLERHAARRVGLRRRVSLLVSPEAPVPMTFGLAQPVLVLPSAALSWSEERLTRVLLHELAHVERGDWAWGLAAEVARALHWMNPLAWVAVSRLRVERERACDDRVLRAGCRPSDYAADLLGVAAGLRDTWRPRGVALPMARPGELEPRLAAILDPEASRERVGAAVAAVAVLAAAALALPVAALAPRAQPADGAGDPPDASVAAEGQSHAEAAPAAAPAPEPEGLVDSALRFLQAPGAPDRASVAAAAPAQELCVFRNEGRRSTRINSNESRTTIEWSTGECDVDVDIRGDVGFAPDDSGITRVPGGARFEIEESFGSTSRRVLAEPGPGGSPAFRYWRNGDERAFEPEGRAWLAAVLPELFRHTTINAEARLRRILEREGVEGALAEIDRMSSDHVAARYFEHLVALADLDEGELRRVFQAARRIDSDHYRSEILTSVVEAKGLTPPVREAYLDALQDIDSDHYTHRLLALLLDQPDLDAANAARVLDTAARQLDSDHYLSEILVDLVEDEGRLDAIGRAAFLRTLRSLDSDHYRTEVVRAFMDGGPMRPEEIADVLDLTTEIDSNHYRAEVLQQVMRDHELDGVALEAWIRALRGVDSDHGRHQTLVEALDHPRLGAAHLGLVLELAAMIESDHYRAELLTRIVRDHRLEGALRDAYIAAAERIESDHYRNRALAALVRSGG